MKRIAALRAGAALALVFAWSGVGAAATRGETHGQVSAVDSVRHSLTLSDGRQLTLDPDAPVRKDGGVATLRDIQRGDDVWASFAPGATTAEEVDAQTPARQVMDGIPASPRQEFLHETWTAGG